MSSSNNQPDPSPPLVAQIKDIVHKNVGPAGLSVAVASTGAPTSEWNAGFADILSTDPISSAHAFGIGSITKTFVAVVVLQLVEEQKLALSDTVATHVDASVCRDIDNAQTATVEQLLSHTAGIDSWEEDPAWIVDGRGSRVRPAHVWAKTDTLDYLRRPRRTAPEPGTWYYSNTNYTLLGLIVESVTKSTAEAEIRRRVLQPLHLDHTHMEGFEQPASASPLPSRYHLANAAFRGTAGVCPAFPQIHDDLIEAKGYNLSVSWTAGGMVSTTSDLVTFAAALRDDKLLTPASAAVMKRWRPAMPNAESGSGLFRMALDGRGSWLGHSGGVLGFSAGLWWEEDGDCIVCLLENAGTVHTGGVRLGVGRLVFASEFLAVASQLVKR